MLTSQLVSLIKRELNESSEEFSFSQKSGLLILEHIKTNNLYSVAWNPHRGGSFEVMPCQHSDLFDLISHSVHKAVQVYTRQKAAFERKKETAQQSK